MSAEKQMLPWSFGAARMSDDNVLLTFMQSDGLTNPYILTRRNALALTQMLLDALYSDYRTDDRDDLLSPHRRSDEDGGAA